MNAIALAIVAGVLGITPLPESRLPIDSLSYSFGGGGMFGAGGSLRISTDGKVEYFYSSAPHTGSGGRVVQQKWELTKEERKELFAKMVAEGLLDADEKSGGGLFDGISVTSGRWRTSVDTKKVPEKAMQPLRALLAKADPVLWGEKEKPPAAPAPKPGVLKQFNYHFAAKADSDHVLLYVGRSGEVSYQRYGFPRPGITQTHVQTSWKIEVKDAELILDALAAGGVLDLETVDKDKFPVHRVEAQVGRWYTLFYAKELPEKFAKHILPLMKKADPEFWK